MTGRGMCQTIKHKLRNPTNIFCLLVGLVSLVLLSNPGLKQNQNSMGKSEAAQEHVAPSASFVSTHLHVRKGWSGLKWTSLISSCRRTDHMFLSQFCTQWGYSNSLKHSVGYHFFFPPLATTFPKNPAGWGIIKIGDIYRAPNNSF